MPTSIREFNAGLYREHLEEASFLYDQRLAYLQDPEIDWPDIRQLEVRLEAHLDALVVGGDAALEVCREQAGAGDAGELYAALRVLCRQGQRDAALAVIGGLDPDDAAKRLAAARALRGEAPVSWQDDLRRAFQQNPLLTAVLADVVGYRRFPFEDALQQRLTEPATTGHAQLARALGRIGSATSVPLLWPLLQNEDERVRSEAAVALMRLGDDRILKPLAKAAASHAWARRVLAIGGDPHAAGVLLDVVKDADPDADTVLALGLLGDLSAVPTLLELLGHEALAEPAAVALNTITGAQLYARTFVPDAIDDDELSDEEREARDADGAVPTLNGRPAGSWERRPMVDAAQWRTWLEENKQRFSRGSRWRMGRRHGPAALVACLKCETTPFAIRAATYEELVVRFGLDIPFEIDLPVSHQQRFLARLEDWAARESDQFDEGRWYFARQRQG